MSHLEMTIIVKFIPRIQLQLFQKNHFKTRHPVKMILIERRDMSSYRRGSFQSSICLKKGTT